MKRVIILLGPTGVGKTGASVILARRLGTEIISADSMQIYRGMDIGTAKPSIEERDGVPHHMLDIVPPSGSFSAGRYLDAVTPVIDRIIGEGKIPLIVGGTGLYIKALTRGIFSGPSADWPLREELLSREEAEPGWLYRELQGRDPEAAAVIDRNDHRRLIRALEVCMRQGERISLLRLQETRPLPHEFIKIGLMRDRDELYRLIDRRVDGMIDSGLGDEVRRLLASSPGQTPLQAIGYKEYAAYLKGEIPLQEAVRLIKRNSRRYAKRQLTWFRKEKGIRWIGITGITRADEIADRVMAVLSGEHGLRPADRSS